MVFVASCDEDHQLGGEGLCEESWHTCEKRDWRQSFGRYNPWFRRSRAGTCKEVTLHSWSMEIGSNVRGRRRYCRGYGERVGFPRCGICEDTGGGEALRARINSGPRETQEVPDGCQMKLARWGRTGHWTLVVVGRDGTEDCRCILMRIGASDASERRSTRGASVRM